MELYLAVLNAKAVCHLRDRFLTKLLALEQKHNTCMIIPTLEAVNLEQTNHGLHRGKVLDLKVNVPLFSYTLSNFAEGNFLKNH